MDNGRYIWCRKCGAIHHVTDFDRYPIYVGVGEEAQGLPANDWRHFMARHAGHRLEPMAATGNHHYPSGSVCDPMSAAYLEVSNGRETLLLRRSRKSIDAPLDYEIAQAELVDGGASLEIQEQAIRKEMKLRFDWSPAAPLADEKISRFVRLFHQVVSRIDPAELRESLQSDVDETVCYCRLDPAIIENLIESCSASFLPAELDSLRRFIETHSDADDVMALVKRRAVTVQASAH